MKIFFTDEMRALMKIFEPYEEYGDMKPDAPKEAVEARKQFSRLFKKAMEDEIANNFA